MSEALDICEVAARALRDGGIDAKARPLSAIDKKDGTVVRLMPSVTRRTYMDGTRLLDCYLQVVSKALDEYEFDRIFPGCRIIDIHEFLLERGITMPVHADTYLYHDPCHTPLRLNPPLETVKKLTGANVVQSERCCGESGLFAVKRPDTASQVRHRKFEEIEKARAKAGIKGHVKMLTTCPGCLQGLSRYEERADMDAEYIVVEMARQILGANWRDQFIRTVKNGGIEKVLV